MISLKPDPLPPVIAPPLASTMKLTKNDDLRGWRLELPEGPPPRVDPPPVWLLLPPKLELISWPLPPARHHKSTTVLCKEVLVSIQGNFNN